MTSIITSDVYLTSVSINSSKELLWNFALKIHLWECCLKIDMIHMRAILCKYYQKKLPILTKITIE